MQKTAVGVEFGADSIKAVRIRVSGSEASIESSVTIDRSEFSSSGDSSAGGGPEAIAETASALRSEMVAAGMSPKNVVLSIDPQESIIRYNQVPPMPASRLGLIMKYEVESIGERMGEALASDFRVLPVVRDDGEQTALLALSKEEPLGEFLDALESAGLTVAAAIPAPVAIFGAWDLFSTKADLDSPDDDLVLVVDVGRAGLNLALILNNRLVFARSGSIGGETFTDALSRELGFSRDDAEKIKLNRGGVDDSQPGVDDRTVNALRGAAGQLLGFLQSSVRFGSSQTGVRLPAVTRLWLTGGGMRLRGLPEYIAAGLGHQPFEVFDPESADSEGKAPCFGLPLGLSAIGLLSTRDAASGVGLSVLPERYRKRRDFRERTRWLYAAASVLVLLLIAQFLHGCRVSGRAEETHKELVGDRSDLEAKAVHRSGAEAKSSRGAERIHRWLREAEPTAFQLFVLDYLGRNLRSEIQIEEVNLEVDVVEDEDAGGIDNVYKFRIRGRVNNESRRAHDWVLELRSLLGQEAMVGSVKVENTRVEKSAWYSFEMVLEPRYTTL